MSKDNVKFTIKKARHSYFWVLKNLDIFSSWKEKDFWDFFSDEIVLKQYKTCKDYKLIIKLFGMLPGDLQELLCQDKIILHRLLHCSEDGYKSLVKQLTCNNDDNDKQVRKKEEFYYSSEKSAYVRNFINLIKNKNIFNIIANDEYFTTITLFFAEGLYPIYEYIDVNKLYEEIIELPFYNDVQIKYKRGMLLQLNKYTKQLLLPEKTIQIFNGKPNSTVAEMRKTLGYMLRTKLSRLDSRNEKLDLTTKSIDNMPIFAFSYLEASKVVDKDELWECIFKQIKRKIVEGTLLEDKYLVDVLGNLPAYTKEYEKRIFNIIVDEMYSDKDTKQQLLNFYFNIFFQGKIEFYPEEKQIILQAIESILLVNPVNLLVLRYRPEKILMYLKFNRLVYNDAYISDGTISPHQIIKLNAKHVNKIISYLDKTRTDELSQIYAEAIKMYFVFGMDKSIDILSGKYGTVCSEFFDNLLKLDISNVEMVKDGSKYKPVINRKFLNFLFSSNRTILKMLGKHSVVATHWYYLYNNFVEISEKCRGNLSTKDATNILLELAKSEEKCELPDDAYVLRNILFELSLGNRSGRSDDDVRKRVIELYYQQDRRTTSSIPYVQGKCSNGYSYEIMKLHDEVIYALGYKAKCCYRVYDIGNNHLEHSLLCENGRVLLIYDENNEIVSFSPLKRNGEVLIANSIESIKYDSKILDATTEGLKEIAIATEDSGEIIKVVCMGKSGYHLPRMKEWPSNVDIPTILEKKHPVYGETDCYHRNVGIIWELKGTKLNELKYGSVDKKYYDPREKICFYDKRMDSEDLNNAIKAINKIKYRKYRENNFCGDYYPVDAKNIFYAFYNEDWFIYMGIDGNYYYDYLNTDSRALREMQVVNQVIKEKTHVVGEDVLKLVYGRKAN